MYNYTIARYAVRIANLNTLSWTMSASSNTSACSYYSRARSRCPVPASRPSLCDNPLRNASSFAILAATDITNTGGTIVLGDLGIFPGTSLTGNATMFITGIQHIGE